MKEISHLKRIFLRYLGNIEKLLSPKKEEERRVHKVFSQYINNVVIDKLLEELPLENKKKEAQIVCFVTEILNYDELYFKYDLTQLGMLIDNYYALVARMIIKNHGDVNCFCGKNIISFYGIFKQVAEKEVIKGAIEIFKVLKDINSPNETTPLTIGIGICSGKVIHGNFGDIEQRVTYTAFGLPINCAMKLAHKKPGINICETVAQLVPENLLECNTIYVVKHLEC